MTEQEINNLIDSKIGKTKMSQLPEATQTSGLYSIGYNGNQSVKYKANLLQGDPLTVRKTYQTEALALADKNPIDPTTSLPLTVGQFVSIVDDGEKNGIYRIASISGDGTMVLELQGKLGDLSDYLKEDDLQLLNSKTNANSLDGIFEVYDNSVNINTIIVNGVSSYDVHKAFKKIILFEGFDINKKYKIGFFRKKASGDAYGFRVYELQDTTWVDVYYLITYEKKELYDVTISGKRVIANIDWSLIPDGFQGETFGGAANTPSVILSRRCFPDYINDIPTPTSIKDTDVFSARFGKELFPCFIRYRDGDIDKSMDSNKVSITTYANILSSFKSLRIIDSDENKLHKLEFIRRNDAGSYAIRLYRLDGANWVNIYYVFTNEIIENAEGVTKWDRIDTTSGVRVIANIDWRNIRDGFSATVDGGNSDPLFIINPRCYQDFKVKEIEDLLQIGDIVGNLESTVNDVESTVNDVVELKVTSDNLVDKDKIQIDKAVYPSGAIFDQPNFAITGEINIDGGVSLVADGMSSSDLTQIYYYNSNRDIIGSPTVIKNNTPIVSPVDTSFAIVNFTRSNPSAYVNTVQLNLGSVVKPYDEYATSNKIKKSALPPDIEGGGEQYDQSLNTTDSVEFASVKVQSMEISGLIPQGTLLSPPLGLQIGDQWADTTDSEENPIIRIKL